MPSSTATLTNNTTTHATAVSHQPSVASCLPAVPVASMYDVVPLHAASSSAPVNVAARRAPRVAARSVHIVPALEGAERRRIHVVAEIALPSAIGETRWIRPALRLDVRHDFPDHGWRQRAPPCRHPLRAPFVN